MKTLARIVGSVAMWIMGAFCWTLLGFIWCAVILWHSRARRTAVFICVCTVGGICGVFLIPAFYLLGEIAGWLTGRC